MCLVLCTLYLVPDTSYILPDTMTKKERFDFVIHWFEQHVPDAETELVYDNPYELLVAVILSAQCTDKRVNMTTPAIFQRYPTVEKLATATFDELFPLIRSISYPNNKTKHLIGMAEKVVHDFHGEIPHTVPELITLPGVGRKTANVITSVIDHQPNMAVDTHVFRVSARIGLTTGAKTPLQTEMQLLKYIPEDKVHIAHHWIILHGRYICVARNPKCGECGLRPACKYYNTVVKKELEAQQLPLLPSHVMPAAKAKPKKAAVKKETTAAKAPAKKATAPKKAAAKPKKTK